MDDDDLRRGRATTHIAFDEATAILVGDALQAHAYNVLATRRRPGSRGRDPPAARRGPGARQRLPGHGRWPGHGHGCRGRPGGARRHRGNLPVEDRAACCGRQSLMPCRLRPDRGAAALDVADRFGRALGLAFQVADDLIDIESPATVIGQAAGVGRPQRQGDAALAPGRGRDATAAGSPACRGPRRPGRRRARGRWPALGLRSGRCPGSLSGLRDRALAPDQVGGRIRPCAASSPCR